MLLTLSISSWFLWPLCAWRKLKIVDPISPGQLFLPTTAVRDHQSLTSRINPRPLDRKDDVHGIPPALEVPKLHRGREVCGVKTLYPQVNTELNAPHSSSPHPFRIWHKVWFVCDCKIPGTRRTFSCLVWDDKCILTESTYAGKSKTIKADDTDALSMSPLPRPCSPNPDN